MGINMKTAIIIFTLFITTTYAKEYYYNNGKNKKTLYLIEDIKISGLINQYKTNKKTKILKVIPSSKTVKIESITQDILPLFSDFPKGAGRIKSLPGGIIVSFKNSLNINDIKQWALDHNLTLIKKFRSQSNTWLIDSPPGLQTLNIINKLGPSEHINKIEPNWWVKISHK